MGLDLPSFNYGMIRSTNLEETCIKGIREKYWSSEENGDSFLETTRFEVSEDGVG